MSAEDRDDIIDSYFPNETLIKFLSRAGAIELIKFAKTFILTIHTIAVINKNYNKKPYLSITKILDIGLIDCFHILSSKIFKIKIREK